MHGAILGNRLGIVSNNLRIGIPLPLLRMVFCKNPISEECTASFVKSGILDASLAYNSSLVSFSKYLLVSVVIYMAFSLVMSIIWLILESPDLAITEAAVGAGVTSILFFVTLKKIRSIRTTAEEDIDE